MTKRHSLLRQRLSIAKRTHRHRHSSHNPLYLDMPQKDGQHDNRKYSHHATSTSQPITEESKGRVMSQRGVSLAFMYQLINDVQSKKRVPNTNLVTLTEDVSLMRKDGSTFKIQAGRTGKILDTDEQKQYYMLELPYLRGETIEWPIKNWTPKPRSNWSVEDICEHIVKPATNSDHLFYNQIINQKYVGPNHRGVFVSQARSTPFSVLLDALSTHFGEDADLAECYVWLDAFSANQPLLTFGDADNDVQDLREWILKYGLHELIASFDEVVLVLDSWQEPVALKRAWCLWELYGAISKRKDGFKVALPHSEMARFEDVLRNDYDSLVKALINVDVANAQCNVTKDLEMIMTEVGENTKLVNSVVQAFLRNWFLCSGKAIRDRFCADESTAESDSTAGLVFHLGRLYKDQGKYKEAESMYVEALRIYKVLHGINHFSIADTEKRLGNLYSDQGKYDEAEVMYVDALRIRKAVHGDNHTKVANTENNLANIYSEQGKYEHAEALYMDALRIKKAAFGADHADVGVAEDNLGNLYSAQGKHNEAMTMHTDALRIFKAAYGPHHPDVAMAQHNLGDLYFDLGNYKKAESLWIKSLQTKKAVYGACHPDVARTQHNLGALYKAQGKYAKAETMYMDALRTKKIVYGQHHPKVAHTEFNLGGLYLKEHKYNLAETAYMDALRIYIALFGLDHLDIARTQHYLGLVYTAQGQYAEAEDRYFDALRIYKSTNGVSHAEVANTEKSLADMYKLWAK